jgi:hypothetical protein
MANTIIIKQSSVPDKVPTTSDITLGELAVNTNDSKMYMKDGSNNINEISGANNQTITGSTIENYGETVNVLGSISGATTIDIADGNTVTATITGATTFTFSTSHTATSFTLLLTDAGTNITWPTIKWEGGTEPTWTTTGEDLAVLTKINSVWYGGALIGMA